MRELERQPSAAPPAAAARDRRRVASSACGAARQPRFVLWPLGWPDDRGDGPLGRGAAARRSRRRAAVRTRQQRSRPPRRWIAPGRAGRSLLGRHRARRARPPTRRFSLHPLMTVTAARRHVSAGAGAPIAGSTPRALAWPETWRARSGMGAIEIAEPDRAAYHAAASMASNFLITARRPPPSAWPPRRAWTARRCSSRWSARRSRTGRRSAPSGR